MKHITHIREFASLPLLGRLVGALREFASLPLGGRLVGALREFVSLPFRGGWWGLFLLLLSACTADEPQLSPMDSRVMLTVRMEAGEGALKSASMADPGRDHGDNNPSWATLGVYLAYANGEVLSYEISREAYEDSVRTCSTAGYNHHVTLSALEGRMTVYAVAFGSKQQFKPVDSVTELRNLASLSVQDMGSDEARIYMQSLFSGKSSETEVSKEAPVHIDVTLRRLVAKIDVQYDVQDAYEGGYVRAAMSGITFKGASMGYFFPDEATGSPAAMDYVQPIDGTVSERNGRAVFYTFPGVRNEVDFEIDYENDGTGSGVLEGVNTYSAQFAEPLAPNTWHYVRFTVRGTQATCNLVISD